MEKCRYCKKRYETKQEALACFYSHKVVYVPMALSDLNGLIHFLYNKDDRFLNPNMVRILKEYATENAKKS